MKKEPKDLNVRKERKESKYEREEEKEGINVKTCTYGKNKKERKRLKKGIK